MNRRRYRIVAWILAILGLAGITLIAFPALAGPRYTITEPSRHLSNFPCSLTVEGCQP